MDLCLASDQGGSLLPATLLLTFLGAAAWLLIWRSPRYRTAYLFVVVLLNVVLVASLIPWGFPGPFRPECADAWREAGSIGVVALVTTVVLILGTRGPRSRAAG
jgi:hypothetical protein